MQDWEAKMAADSNKGDEVIMKLQNFIRRIFVFEGSFSSDEVKLVGGEESSGG